MRQLLHDHFLVCRLILWNAVTSPENVLSGSSVKTKLYETPSPISLYYISDNNGGQGYWISQNSTLHYSTILQYIYN